MGGEDRLARPALLLATVAACGRDVLVGYDVAPDAAAEAATDAAIDARSDATADGEGGAQGQDGALAIAADPGGAWLAAGYAGGPTGTEPTSDAAVFHVDVTGQLQLATRVDLFGDADRANAVFAPSAGSHVIAGGTVDAGRTRAFVRGLTASDTEAWTTMLDEPQGGESEAFGLSPGMNGTLVVGGTESRAGLPVDGWVARLDSAGKLVSRFSLRGTPGANTTVRTVGVDLTRDEFFTGGERNVADGGVLDVPAILMFGTAQQLYNSSVTTFGANTPGTVRGVFVVQPAVSVFVCADLHGTAGVALIDYFTFKLLSSYTYSAPDPLTLGGCAATSDGAAVLVGTTSGSGGPQPWAAKHDLASFTPRWTRTLASPAAPALLAVAADGAGGAFAAGTTPPPQAHTWTPIAP